MKRRRDFGCVVSVGTPTDPAFLIRWFENGTRRQKSGFSTRKSAQEELARVRTSLGDGTAAAQQRAETLFKTVAEEWLRVHSKPNLRSHDDNIERWRKHLEPTFGALPLSAVTPQRILEYRARMQTETKLKDKERVARWKAGTINRTLALLRSVLKYAVTAGYITACPIDRIGRGKFMLPIEKAKLEPPIGTAEDVGRLLEKLREMFPHYYALYATAVYCGLRKGELAGLRRSDVDLTTGFITVRRSYSKTTKSGKHRLVPVPPPLKTILAAHIMAQAPGELLFTDELGAMIKHNARLGVWLAEALEETGLKRIRFHDTRHVYGSFYIMSGGNIFDLQRNLGHSTVELTASTYAHLSADHRVKEAARLSFVAPKAGNVKVVG